MPIAIQASIDHAQRKQKTVETGVVERVADAAPSSGLGLFLAESRELLAALQAVVVAEQTKKVVRAMTLRQLPRTAGRQRSKSIAEGPLPAVSCASLKVRSRLP